MSSEYSAHVLALLAADPQVAFYELRSRQRGAEFYARFVRALPPEAERVLDVGCGAGRLTTIVGARVKFTVGIDRSPTMLELAKERAPHACWLHADANVLPFGDASFDGIVSSSILRLTDLTRSLSEIKRVLKPGGALVIRDIKQGTQLELFNASVGQRPVFPLSLRLTTMPPSVRLPDLYPSGDILQCSVQFSPKS